tara:strand:- start:46 stop:306 length:261 start_codon:yes stop_codon:yes gene_type:complete
MQGSADPVVISEQKYVIAVNCMVGSGVTVGADKTPFILSESEATEDLNLLLEGDENMYFMQPVTQNEAGDWVDEFSRNWSEIARNQ